MFNEIQKGLLIEARQHIEKGTERFICCAINSAVHTARDANYDTCWYEASELKEQIDFGIDGYSCLDLWMFSEVGIYPNDLPVNMWENCAPTGGRTPVSREAFNDLCLMARLAWLDRALETGSLT
jgi:hypothetical protein